MNDLEQERAEKAVDPVLQRIDDVLKDNKRIELIYIGFTVVLFSSGIACIIAALITGKLAWSTPSAVTTGLLYFPLQEIKDLRRKNIALATAPALIAMLPKGKAAEEIQKLLQTLYGKERRDGQG